MASVASRVEIELLIELEQGVFRGARAEAWLDRLFAHWEREPYGEIQPYLDHAPLPPARSMIAHTLFREARDAGQERANMVLRQFQKYPSMVRYLECAPSMLQFFAFGSFSPRTLEDTVAALLRADHPPSPHFWLSAVVARFRTWRTRHGVSLLRRENDTKWCRMYARVFSRLVNQNAFPATHPEFAAVRAEYVRAADLAGQLKN